MENIQIKIKNIDGPINIDKFVLSNGSIRNILSGAYDFHLKKLKSVYKILLDDKTIGYYIISIKTINTTYNRYNFEDDEEYPIIYLDILCIDDRYQGKGIGTAILKTIIAIARKISDQVGCRFIILDALKEKKQWYLARGFDLLENGENDKPTITMGIDFIDLDKINDYISNP